MTTVDSEEKKMFSEILAKLNRIEARLEDMEYPPEEAIKESFIKQVEQAEGEIKKGKSKKISLQEFKEKYSP